MRKPKRENAKIQKYENTKTRKHGNTETRKHGNTKTRKHENTKTRTCENANTRNYETQNAKTPKLENANAKIIFLGCILFYCLKYTKWLTVRKKGISLIVIPCWWNGNVERYLLQYRANFNFPSSFTKKYQKYGK
jgi:hypothetical protein